MAKKLSIAQKTFVDLYDSYNLNLSSDVVAVPCDQYGAASEEYTTRITFSASAGVNPIGSKCELISTQPTGVAVTINNDSNYIDITVTKGTNLEDDFKLGFKITTTDNSDFEFKRYITFVKVKNGEKAITFKMYSADGDTFKEGSNKITVKAALFDGLTKVEISKCTWSYYNTTNTSFITYNKNNTSTLDVYRDARSGDEETIFTMNDDTMVLKCVITYQGASYEDYITLKRYNNTYDLVIKFFNGKNVFSATEPFVIAYLETYRDRIKVEGIRTNYYYYHPNNTYDAKTDKHTFNGSSIDQKYKTEGTLIYVVYKVVNGALGSAKYKIALCQYTGSAWKGIEKQNTYNNNYVYRCSLYTQTYATTSTNVFVIAKEDIVNQENIDFIVYKKILDNKKEIVDDDLRLAVNTSTVFDLNDPVVSKDQPPHPKDGQLWLDIRHTPYLLYIYDQARNTWEYFSQQNGKTVYTSAPSKYDAGDLWIVAKKDKHTYTENGVTYNFPEGSMFRATTSSDEFDPSHWTDALEALTQLQNDIRQNFDFTSSDGLIISRNQKKFYTQITSDQMAFYSNGKKEVWIGNNTTNIDNVTVEDKATFDCKNGVTLNSTTDVVGHSLNIYQNANKTQGFSLKIESNGSFSLVLVK